MNFAQSRNDFRPCPLRSGSELAAGARTGASAATPLRKLPDTEVDPVMSMTAHDILREARELIDREGWVQHALHIPGEGYCALGAHIAAVACGRTHVCERGIAFAALKTAVGSRDVVGWNNAPGRTKAEVLAAFDKAIAATAPKADLPGPSREIIVEPVEQPATTPLPDPEPAPAPVEPARPEPVPA